MKRVVWRPERLRELRKSKGMSQAAIAEGMGLTRNTYARYETGRREPGIEKLAALCVVFGCKADYLLGLSSAPDRTYQDEARVGEGGVA